VDISPLLRPLMGEVFGITYGEEKMGSYTFLRREFADEESVW